MNPRVRFGESLRQQRERRNISLEQIARDTKISRSLFVALERGDCSRWPPGVYGRAYVRSYADAVGLDSNAIAAEFGEHFPEVAWPDRPPALPVEAAAASAPPRPPAELPRLSFATDTAERWRRARERAFIVVIETLGLVVCAALLAMSGADFWLGLAVVSLGYHAFGSVLMGGSPADWSIRLRVKGAGSDAISSKTARAVLRSALLRFSRLRNLTPLTSKR